MNGANMGSLSLYLMPENDSNFTAKVNYTAKFLLHENYGDWELRGPCREHLHYLWKRAVRIVGKPFSIDSADFPCRDPAIPSPRGFHGVEICSVVPSTPKLYVL